MLENLIELDQNLFLSLNQAGLPLLDPVMRLFSATWIWIPIYLILAYVMVKSNRLQGLLALAFLLLTLIMTEQISVHAFKEVFERLRPCHDPDLQNQIRLVASHCGGLYGFVSTHATNAAGLFLFSSLYFRKKTLTWVLLVWVVLVSYSRIYLGVHFPGDILGGWLLGLTLAASSFSIYSLVKRRLFNHEKSS